MLTLARKNYLNDSRSRERRGRKEHAVEIGDSIIKLVSDQAGDVSREGRK